MDKKNLITSILKDTGAEVFNLSSYPEETRRAYVSMISSLAWSDGSIDDREKEILDSIMDSAGLNNENELEKIIADTQKFNLENYDKWVEHIKDKPLKIALMVDMFLTAFADTVCMQSESIYMKYIAGKLDIDMPLYDVIRKNVEQFLKEKSGEEKPVSYEKGEANKHENSQETENESFFRRFVNSLIKSVIF